jgi:hypothetical protein
MFAKVAGMRGEFVMAQADIQTALTKPDTIGIGSSNSGSHNVRRVVLPDGTVANERGYADVGLAIQDSVSRHVAV